MLSERAEAEVNAAAIRIAATVVGGSALGVSLVQTHAVVVWLFAGKSPSRSQSLLVSSFLRLAHFLSARFFLFWHTYPHQEELLHFRILLGERIVAEHQRVCSASLGPSSLGVISLEPLCVTVEGPALVWVLDLAEHKFVEL